MSNPQTDALSRATVNPERIASVSRLPEAAKPFGVHLAPVEGVPGLFTCADACGCIFWPDTDSGLLYPDRYVRASGCDDAACGCHALAYSVPDPGAVAEK